MLMYLEQPFLFHSLLSTDKNNWNGGVGGWGGDNAQGFVLCCVVLSSVVM